MNEESQLRRRGYLGIAGTLMGFVAGCLGNADSQSDTTTERPTDTPPDIESQASSASQVGTTEEPPTSTETETETHAGTHTPTETDDDPTEAAVSAAEKSISEVSFQGSWFDTHAHWRMGSAFNYDDYSTDALTARQREHEVGATVLFVPHEPFHRDYKATVETLAREHVDYLPFLFPGGFPSAEKRQSYYEDHEAIYHGLGEVTFYSGVERGMALTDEPFPQYFQMSADEDLVLMLHPTEQQAGDLGPMLAEYPDATLLLHGFELLGTFETLETLLTEHDNLYWTYDTATMLGGLMVTARGKSEFTEKLEANRDRFFQQVTSKLPRLLEAAPQRVMWGTDVVADWHVDPDIYGQLMSFSENVRDALPENHRDPWAYENAVKLFDG